MALPRTRRAPSLAIAMIDDDRIDAVVAGDFDAGRPDEMLERLGRLARCRTQHLRVDLSGVDHLDERGARGFVEAAESAGRTGGVIEYVGVSAEVEGALRSALERRHGEVEIAQPHAVPA